MQNPVPRIETAFDIPSEADLAEIRPKGRRRAWLAIPLVLAGLVGVGLWAASLGGSTTDWQTEPVTRGDLDLTVTAVGQLAPEDAVEVGSDLSGRVEAVLVEKNATVHAGQVLAQLDAGPFEHAVSQATAQLSSARASVAKAEVELENARVQRDRTSRLLEKGAVSATELESADLQVRTLEATLQTARAQRDQASASLADARDDLTHTTILSPIDGVVIQRFVDPGQTVVSSMSATALFEVASDLSALEVEVAVDEADVGHVQAGQPARFTVSAHPDATFEAEVVSVDLAPDPDASVVSYPTELRVDNREGLLRPGMTATADIVVTSIEDALQVPTLALRYRPASSGPPAASAAGDRVYVLRDGSAVAVPVRVLGTDGLFTAVVADGLAEGDAIVLGGGR
ncbi:MAG: efflux RND transporter periplasmic adaptor subunit [Myxococcota bacterium]